MSRTRKRVLFLIPSLVGGGAERVFTILLRHLDRDRFEPQLAVLESGGAYTGDVPDDVKIHDLRVQRVRYAMPSLIRLIWKVRPDTIVSTLGHLNVAISMLRYLLPPEDKSDRAGSHTGQFVAPGGSKKSPALGMALPAFVQAG